MGHSRMGGRRKNSSGRPIVNNDRGRYDKCDCMQDTVTIDNYNVYEELYKTGEEVLTVEKFSCTCIKKDSSEITIADMIIYIICVCFASMTLGSVVFMNCVDFYNNYMSKRTVVVNGRTYVGTFNLNDVKKLYENIQSSRFCNSCTTKMRKGDSSCIRNPIQCSEICSSNNIEKCEGLLNLFKKTFIFISDNIVYMVMNWYDEKFKKFFINEVSD